LGVEELFVRLAGCLLSVCQRIRIVNPTLPSQFGVSGVVYALFLVRQNSIIAVRLSVEERASSEFLQRQH